MGDTTTRSGMLWEVERILKECKDKPSILVMENVPMVHGKKNMESFTRWIASLESMGYNNYWQDMIATDYGIPQTRNRCFMVSVLNGKKYTFPSPVPLKLKLKDLLEDNVDEKYYLCEKAVNGLIRQMDKKHKPTIIDVEDEPNKPFSTITCGYMKQGHYEAYLKIKNNTKKGYLEATDGDGIDLAQPNSKTRRGRVQKDTIQTLTTKDNLGVVVKPKVLGG